MATEDRRVPETFVKFGTCTKSPESEPGMDAVYVRYHVTVSDNVHIPEEQRWV